MSSEANKKEALLKSITGRGGEDEACRYLADQGYAVIHRNYRIGHKEIDIIAENEKYIVFVEVKTRTVRSGESRYGRPSAAVDAAKRRALASCAKGYIKSHRSDKFYRFDVIEVVIRSDRISGEGKYEINHMKGVFGAGGRIWI